MEKDKEVTKVIFRYWFPASEDFEWTPKYGAWKPPKSVENRARREGHGEVIALFPEIPADYEGRLIGSYIKVGQHGGANYHGVKTTSVKATPEEYAEMKKHLEEHFGYNLKVVQKITPKIRENFRKNLEALK